MKVDDDSLDERRTVEPIPPAVQDDRHCYGPWSSDYVAVWLVEHLTWAAVLVDVGHVSEVLVLKSKFGERWLVANEQTVYDTY